MLMGANNRRVDEEFFEVGVTAQGLGDAIPYPVCFPAGEADIHRVPVAKLRRQVPPGIANTLRVE